MQIDLKTVNIEPKRKAFDHLVRRFGDKPASRYQEASYDIQATENLHYRPTWAPEQELYDPTISRIVMADWHALKDPRQYYYNSYVLTRARQQEAAEGAFALVESRGLHLTVPEEMREQILDLLVPLRHAAWGANQNNVLVSGYGFGTPFTQPCLYYGMDCLAVAQYLSRIGLMLGGVDALARGKAQWMDNEEWQPLRRLVEDTLVVRDPFELFIAQDVVIDGLLYPLIYDSIIDGRMAQNGAAPVSMLTQFMTDWGKETRKWAISVVKVAAAESEANAVIIGEWFRTWSERAMAALLPVIAKVMGEDADQLLAGGLDDLKAQLAKAGVSL
ncbi:phenol hydroxylase [Novosphingobium naphthalenivorans]|uniref:phenol hydroxylase n=1 Tax=Novosphingobium naphthalenivorans TaxID=273168 RepID=UPI00082B3F96|nr:phenol hydroxylase [Novosphingobium naphthalenivorans]